MKNSFSTAERPQPSPHCPRMHGYFAHEDPRICNTFYYCVEGKFNMITCPEGLVFSERTGICNWPDEAQKKGCGSRELFNFTCPRVDEAVAATHPRYPDTEDCQYFYVCVNGQVPRRSGCKLGQAFDERTGKCDWARRIPEWYDFFERIARKIVFSSLSTLSQFSKLNLQQGLVQGSIDRRGVGRVGKSAAEAEA